MTQKHPQPNQENDPIHWKEGNIPHSKQFQDIYFSCQDGLAESRYHFLRGIGAPDIWQNRESFSIGETGFGFGLNFIMTLKAWKETAAPDAKLHYIATEKYPISRDHIIRALRNWPELDTELQALWQVYPDQPDKSQTLELCDGRVRLSLLIGDSLNMLQDLNMKVDAWYLDGFSPRTNPDMWTNILFRNIARLSVTGARLGTFTAVGSVRRGLEASGFKIKKQKGFGKKRDCLRGTFKKAPKK